MIVLAVLAAWVVLSIPVGMLVGRRLRATQPRHCSQTGLPVSMWCSSCLASAPIPKAGGARR